MFYLTPGRLSESSERGSSTGTSKLPPDDSGMPAIEMVG